MKRRNRTPIAFYLMLSLIFIWFSLFPMATHALNNNPFGGRIFFVRNCNCSRNFFLTIGPPRGGNYIYDPRSTKLYEFGQITRVGVWTLGTWERPAVCVYGDRCQNTRRGRLINIVGTSR